jgi:hypothetical protein
MQHAADLASEVFEEALRLIGSEPDYGPHILTLTADFSIFHAVELTEAETPDRA